MGARLPSRYRVVAGGHFDEAAKGLDGIDRQTGLADVFGWRPLYKRRSTDESKIVVG